LGIDCVNEWLFNEQIVREWRKITNIVTAENIKSWSKKERLGIGGMRTLK
jgi:hypothetical protein